MTKFLKDRSYYENLYDNWMIEDCIRLKSTWIEMWKQEKYKDLNLWKRVEWLIIIRKSDWYEEREEKIDKMMRDDEKRDELLENSIPFENKHCRNCNWLLEYEFKEFYSWNLNVADRILFFYKCTDCWKRQWIYSDWEEIVSKPKLCNKCNEIINHKARFEWDILIEEFNCNDCWNEYIEKSDFSVKKEIKRKITEKERLKYWYNKKESDDYIESFSRLDDIHKTIMEQKEKDIKKDLYEKAKKLNKLNIVWLQKLLNKEFENTKFSEFKVNSNKQVKRWLEIEFNLFFDWDFWENPQLELNKLFDKILINTNWKAIKDSIYEKLGSISGRLIGYDNEDDLVELIEKRDKKKN